MVSGGQRLKSGEEAPLVEVRETAEGADRPLWTRLRSAGLLALLLAGLGVAAAALVGVVAIAVAALMDQALG